MALDCSLFLPADVRSRDVLTVMGIAAGLPIDRHSLSDDAVATWCTGVSTRSIPMVPEMVEFNFDGLMVDGRYTHSCNYHYEGPRGQRQIHTASTPFWGAICVRTALFFGGSVDLNDCDSCDVDFSYAKKGRNDHEDNASYDRFQKRMTAVRPIDWDDMALVAPLVSYPAELVTKRVYNKWTKNHLTLHAVSDKVLA